MLADNLNAYRANMLNMGISQREAEVRSTLLCDGDDTHCSIDNETNVRKGVTEV